MLAAVNAARAAQSLSPLAREARLDAAACRQAKDLGRHALFDVEGLSHRSSDGSELAQRLRDAGYGFRAAAENLAAGVADPAKVVSLWMASEGHRRNILTGDFREAGMAQVRSTLSARLGRKMSGSWSWRRPWGPRAARRRQKILMIARVKGFRAAIPTM